MDLMSSAIMSNFSSSSKILVAGASGMVGSAIVRSLQNKGFTSIIGTYNSRLPQKSLFSENSSLRLTQADLRDQRVVVELFDQEKPDYVFLAAAKVGGILANSVYRADFISDNILITTNVLNQSYSIGVRKVLNLGSTCIYPRDCPQPMKEEYLLTSPLEYTNEPYAIAKIAGLKMCESFNLQYGTNFISAMPTNLYGIGDNFDLQNAHVFPALLRKMHLAKLLQENNNEAVMKNLNMPDFSQAKRFLDSIGVSSSQVTVWGTGAPKREFLWSEDMADACVFLMEKIDFEDLKKEDVEIRNTHINIGTGVEVTINYLAEKIKKVVQFEGKIIFDSSKPDGTPRKLTDVSRIHSFGWRHSVDLDDGIKMFYNNYLAQYG